MSAIITSQQKHVQNRKEKNKTSKNTQKAGGQPEQTDKISLCVKCQRKDKNESVAKNYKTIEVSGEISLQ